MEDRIAAWGRRIQERNRLAARTCMLRNPGSRTLHKPFAMGDGRGCCNYEGISVSVASCGTSLPGGGYEVVNFATVLRPEGPLCRWCFRRKRRIS